MNSPGALCISIWAPRALADDGEKRADQLDDARIPRRYSVQLAGLRDRGATQHGCGDVVDPAGGVPIIKEVGRGNADGRVVDVDSAGRGARQHLAVSTAWSSASMEPKPDD